MNITNRWLGIFTRKSFWGIIFGGAVTAAALVFYLGRFENHFLGDQHIDYIKWAVLGAFLMTAAVTAYFQGAVRPDGRNTWMTDGSGLDSAQYHTLLNAVSDIVFELDAGRNVLFINDRFSALTKIPIDDVAGHDFFSIFPPEQREANIARFERFVAGELKPYRVKTFIEMYDGTHRQIEVSFKILNRSAEGVRVTGTITDKQSHAAAKKAILEAEQKYKDMFDNGVSGIYQSTPEGKFLNVNPALAKILGYNDVNDVLKSVHSIAAQIYVRPEERAIFKNQIDHNGIVGGFETQMYKKDGSKIWVVENSRAVHDEKGQLKYYEGSLWDITERRESEQALKEAKLIAEMSSRTKTEFLANMSHELRTPLNAIIGFSEILKDEIMGPLGSDCYKDYAQDIYTSGNNLLKIISEILEVSKIEAGNRQLNEGPVRMSRAIGGCLVILKGKLEEHNLTVQIDLAHKLPELVGEELVIKQILLNLVGNAIKFTPAGGTITIKSYLEAHSGRLLLDIIDNGIGMDAEELEKCIQPFWQANASLARETSGTGLGLTLVQSLAKMHQASLQMISEKGKGTTARIIFPAERVLKTDVDAAASAYVSNAASS